MKKILIIILFLGLSFPLISLAGGTYKIPVKYYTDTNNNKVYDKEDILDGTSSITYSYEGLVPCGKEITINGESVFVPCTFCHLFILMNNVLKFALVNIVPPLAALMMVIAGIMFFFAGTSPEMMEKSKKIFYSTIIGLAIIYGSWIIINTTLTFIGVADWTGLQGGWFTISCPISPIYVPH